MWKTRNRIKYNLDCVDISIIDLSIFEKSWRKPEIADDLNTPVKTMDFGWFLAEISLGVI